MIMVQRAPVLPMFFNAPQHQQRVSSVHPVAPSIVVQPTATPGLLSLSRPSRRAQKQRSTPPAKSRRSPQLAPAKVDSPVAAPVSSPPRKEKPRTVSQPSPTPAPRRARPLSQQVPSPSPAANHRRGISTSALSDPFLVSPMSANHDVVTPFLLKPFTLRTTPKLARPSGRLARSRRDEPFSPTPGAKTITPRVPARRPTLTMSHSLPNPTHGFRVCDDTTDTEDESPAPVTPTRIAFIDDAPRTAPPTGMPCCGFDSFFGELSIEEREKQLKDAFFASSQFQNSPEPEDLPIPAFMRL